MIYGYMIFELRALLVSKIFHIECHVKPTVVALIFLCINFGGFIKKHSSICCQSSYQYKKLVEIALHWTFNFNVDQHKNIGIQQTFMKPQYFFFFFFISNFV